MLAIIMVTVGIAIAVMVIVANYVEVPEGEHIIGEYSISQAKNGYWYVEGEVMAFKQKRTAISNCYELHAQDLINKVESMADEMTIDKMWLDNYFKDKKEKQRKRLLMAVAHKEERMGMGETQKI